MRNPSSSSSSKKPQPVAASTGASGGRSSSSAVAKTTPCCTKVGIKRGPWTPEEDELLATYIKREGEGRWRTLPKKAGLLRCGKSCRLRWMNYLRPSVKRGHIAPDEEDLILRLHRLLGNRWSLIAGRIPGRTDNEIKNYWNTHLSKKLISQGIDPRTHKPLDLESNSHNENKASSSNGDHVLAAHEPNFSYAPLVQDPTNGRSSTPLVHDDQYKNAAMTVGNENQNTPNEDDEIEDINYCTDDIFSSFLNSLINEDVFNSQNIVHEQQQLQPNNVIDEKNSDSLISSTHTFTFGPGWEAPVVACTSPFDQNNSNRLNEHVEKHF
ncbi:hypothetical protein ACH5RR_009099 [Cinchona calisaya]|uniref:Uncharacterized protein n=1 Tax=Cinchona calisaya TaxID=153742 RepID=A0ABD3AG93_9GENT